MTFLRRHNGGEGFIGSNYLILWKAEEILPFNRDYEVERMAPDLLAFGSNGGGEAFAFDKREQSWPIVMVFPRDGVGGRTAGGENLLGVPTSACRGQYLQWSLARWGRSLTFGVGSKDGPALI